MKIIYSEPIASVKEAVQMANNLLKDSQFFKSISEHSSFDLSTATPKIIAELLETSDLEFKVEIFYPNILQTLKYRKTFAFTDSRFPNTVFLNFKKLDRKTEDIAATIIHESIHALDDAEEKYTFGHGNNSPVGKDNTAPYWIGKLAYKILTGDSDTSQLAFDQIEEA